MRRLLAAIIIALLPTLTLATCPQTTPRGLYQCPVGTPSPEWVNDIFTTNMSALNFSCTTPLTCAAGANPVIAITSPIPVSMGGFGVSGASVLKGAVPAFSADGVVGFVPPNTTTTQKYLCETGTGSVGAMPSFCAGPTNTVSALSQLSNTLCPFHEVLESANPAGWFCNAYPDTGDSVLINGSNIINANFNVTTPTPPSGATNVTWQITGSNPTSVSGYVYTFDPTQFASFPKGISIGDNGYSGNTLFIETNPTAPFVCGFAGFYGIWIDSASSKIHVCDNGVETDLVPAAAATVRATFGGSTAGGTAGATMLATMYKPVAGITLTRVNGVVLAPGTCSSCGVTDHTFRVTDGSTNSDCTNVSAVTCTSAAGTKFSCTPSNTGRAAGQELLLETVAGGGTCTTQPVLGLVVEYVMQ